MRFNKNVLTCLVVVAALAGAIALQSDIARAQQAPAAGNDKVIAIDILLDPDAKMVQHATAANAELLKNFPKGYTLGGQHAPHVSVLQRYVYKADLDKIFAAATKVFAKEDPTSWKLKLLSITTFLTNLSACPVSWSSHRATYFDFKRN